ncbi:hypothetical protein DEA06_15340 [Microbacterium sp. Gd 4-13]|uniref:hypothetical protein n=1 Tax=Microbacterium sp. Gd 4-13 TaxID=2173179 RepID=UPI000D5882A8|nr:hypothetical protein [Microbacterium sp. Gd 4-13]PVW02518.1 hypothetical protein DEA06_15340 [Microbacterium sp. Gd 4-13]
MDPESWAAVGSFTLDALAILIAPAAALTGALGGAAIANRRAAQREREQRAEARRDAARGLMVELLHSGNAWRIKLQHSNISAIIDSMRTPDEDDSTAKGDTASELRALRERLEMAFTDILLRVENVELRTVIEHCRAEMDRSREVTGAVDKRIREKDLGLSAEMRAVFDYVQSFGSELRTMEQAAIPYFAAAIR